MLYTTQCHHPLPVGASGSYIVSAKLLVPAGAPLQESAGERLFPVQPMTVATCAFPTVPPSLMSVLVSLNADFCAPALESAAKDAMKSVMRDFISVSGLWPWVS